MRRSVIITVVSVAILFCLTVTSFAAEDQNPQSPVRVELTLDEAINSALKNSFSIRQAELDVDRAEEVRDAAWEYHGYMLTKTWVETEQAFVSIPGMDDMSLFQALSADRAAHIQKKTFEIMQDAVKLQVTQAYYDIHKKLEDLDTARLALESAERGYRVAKIKHEIGLATGMEVQGKKAELEGAKSGLEMAQAELENAYRKLNKLMGKDVNFRPELATPVEFEKLEVPSLDAEITRAMNPNQNPYLWSKKEGYELQRYVWTTTQPAEAGKIDIDKAKLSYEEARVETRKTMNELYQLLKTLEAAHESAVEALAAAEQALKTAQVMYENGMITGDDLLGRKIAVAKAEGDLLNVRIQYELVKINFEKPWLSFLG